MKHAAKRALFEQVHTQYRTLLESVIWRLTGDRDRFAEAYQNAMLALWRHIDKLGQGQPGGYIYRIALSAANKTWRSRPAKGSDISGPVMAQSQGPEDDLIREESYHQLRRHILALPEKQAQAVAMRYLQSKSYAQMARELQCSESAVRAQVSRALTRLRKKMNPASTKESKYEYPSS